MNGGAAEPSSSHAAITAVGDSAVCTRIGASPASDFTSSVTTWSAFETLPASTISNWRFGSIQTGTAACFVKACGSRSSVASSRSSFASFLPGLRPVVCSICSARSSARRFTTEAGSTFCSILSFISHWPPTNSISGPWAVPRGAVQPSDRGWVAPQGANAACARLSSTCSGVADHPATMR